MSINFDKKMEDASTLLLSVRQQIKDKNEELDHLKASEQQIIGRLQTYNELRLEAASQNGSIEEPELVVGEVSADDSSESED